LQAIFDLEATNQELKPQLRDLYITSAKELEFFGNARKAIVVHVRLEPCCASSAGPAQQFLLVLHHWPPHDV
jgi:Ribosomal protein S7e